MKITDIEKARVAAERIQSAERCADLVESGTLRVIVGNEPHAVEIKLTPEFAARMRADITRALKSEIEAAVDELKALGVEV